MEGNKSWWKAEKVVKMIKVVGKTWWKTVEASKNISGVRQWYMKWVMTTFWAQKIAMK